MLSMAAADGRIDTNEIDLIFDLISVQQLTEESHLEIQRYLIKPPPLESCLSGLRYTVEAIRHGLMLGLLQVAWADEVMDPAETTLLDSAQRFLAVSRRQRSSMEGFVAAVRKVTQRGVDDDQSTQILRESVASLTDARVPITAVYFAGSIIRLRAAGICEGLEAIGLGVGTVPGLDVAVLFSVELCMGVRKALGRSIEERREQRAMKNLQGAINELIDRVVELEESADENTTDLEAMKTLTKRLRTLQQALYSRRTNADG